MAHNIRVNTEGFRAIKSANIIIDGITLVAGENGCGKSTLSKLLYFLYKTVSNYDVLVKKELFASLEEVTTFLQILKHDIIVNSKDRSEWIELRNEIPHPLNDAASLEDERQKLTQSLKKTADLYGNLFPDEGSRTGNRIKRIMKRILEEEEEDATNDDVNEMFGRIREKVEGVFKEANGKIESRPLSLFKDELKRVFTDEILPKVFEVYEFEEAIVSLKKSNLGIPYSIQNTIYIDTPMMLGVLDSHNLHWGDLNNMLLENKNRGVNEGICSMISSNIKGDVSVAEDLISRDEFRYTRDDGAIYNLLDVATGIKAFSIIQLLLKNGKLNDKTLLIIDEPESNLHPQWIVEYARLIVLLNKELGVKFFLASHNPDMVSAIRYISEKEGILENINFYLAEQSVKNHLYDYKHLGVEIDPIFESFNIALDRINQYGA